jgi:hypothetical protein
MTLGPRSTRAASNRVEACQSVIGRGRGSRTPGARFTIRGFMIAIAILAGVLALPGGWREVGAALSLLWLALFAARRILVAGNRRLAATVFASLAIAANVLCVCVCASPGMESFVMFMLWLFILLPTLGGFGAVWVVLATRGGVGPHRSRRLAWAWVMALAVMPGVTCWSAWPFRLRFLSAKPALEHLADQIEARQAVSFPQHAGSFRIVASRGGPGTGGVALLIDPNPSGPSGFVRHKDALAGQYACFSPIRGDWWHVALGSGWCYHEED